jgi:hypothetical protein
LRIQLETYDINYGISNYGAGGGGGGLGGMDGGLLSRGRILERSFAKIKLFRDKVIVFLIHSDDEYENAKEGRREEIRKRNGGPIRGVSFCY